MASRFYFYTLEGKEINSKWSNKAFASCGACLAIKQGNDWVKNMAQTIRGEVITREEIGVFINDQYETKKITIEDFEGFEVVLVKKWAVNPSAQEWFLLRARHEHEQLACDVPVKY